MSLWPTWISPFLFSPPHAFSIIDQRRRALRSHFKSLNFGKAIHIFRSMAAAAAAAAVALTASMEKLGEGLGEGTLEIDFDDNTLERYRISRTPSPVIIKNCVATAFFGTQLDLEEISWKKHGEFNPSSFAAAKFRLSSPSTTALIFASGKIVCTGAASEDSAEVAILKYFRMVNSVDVKAVCIDICIENIVGTAYLGHAINLHQTFAWLKSQGYVGAMYSPELFPGLRFVPQDLAPYLPPTKVLVFQEGNVVICGAKAREELLQTWIILRAILKQFEQETVRAPPFNPVLNPPKYPPKNPPKRYKAAALLFKKGPARGSCPFNPHWI